nr:hypothetical protein [Tanacetum cinerariifolium]
KKRGFFQKYIFQVIKKRFEFEIRRRLRVVVEAIAKNLSNSEKISSLRMVPLMEWRILLPSSRRTSKYSSNVSSITSILKHVSSFE